jgi:hypothetical protein
MGSGQDKPCVICNMGPYFQPPGWKAGCFFGLRTMRSAGILGSHLEALVRG